MKHYYLRAEKYKHTTKAFVLPDGTWTKRHFKPGREFFVVVRWGRGDNYFCAEEIPEEIADIALVKFNGGE